MSLFKLEKVQFQYGEHNVLDIPKLTIEEERIVCLTGTNGSGKSTLLNMLAGLLPPSSGRILYRNVDLSKAHADTRDRIRKDLGVCLQSPYLFHATAEWNVMYGLAARGVKGRDKSARAEEALQYVGLGGFGNRRYNALSGGEIQRVALARALAADPRVLLLDEPMANVDNATRILLERLLKDLAGSRKKTIILSTHDTDQARRLGQQIITLHEGRIEEGGQGNIFQGNLGKEGDNWIFDTGLVQLRVLPLKDDARTAVIPPEAVLLSLEPMAANAGNVLYGKVTGLRMRDGAVEVTIDAGEEFTSRITGESLKKLGLKLGVEVHLFIEAKAIKMY
jgi:tungstate transport system ATP-binding protein